MKFLLALYLFNFLCYCDKTLLIYSGKERDITEFEKILPKGTSDDARIIADTTLEKLKYSKEIKLMDKEELLYDNLILMAPNTSNRNGTFSFPDPKDHLNLANLVLYLKKGGNIILFVDSSVTDHWREFADEVGISIESSEAKDYSSAVHDDPLVFSGGKGVSLGLAGGSFAFSGVGLSISESNPLAFGIVKAPTTALSGTKSLPMMYLVAGLQTRTKARVAIIGSLDCVNNEYLNDKKLMNRNYLETILAWGTLRHNVLSIESIDPIPLKEYRIKDNFNFSISVSVLDHGIKKPFNPDDLQLEIIMLDPYYRLTLACQQGKCSTGSIMLPDQFGVFTLRVNYQRKSYNPLLWTEQVVIRPFRMDEYDRFIPQAFPYYINIGSMMIGFLMVLMVVTFGSSVVSEEKKKK